MDAQEYDATIFGSMEVMILMLLFFVWDYVSSYFVYVCSHVLVAALFFYAAER
jgi:hypothetical protein